MAMTPITQTLTITLLLIISISISISISIPSASSQTSLSVSPKTLTKLNNTVQIQWTNVPSPSDLDWLGIYSPPSSSDSDFIGYLFLNSSPSSLTGSGSISLPLVNLRSNYQFRIFRWTRSEVDYNRLDYDNNPLPGTQHRLAVSEEAGFQSAHGPDQVHLTFTDEEDEMRVMFVVGEKGEGKVRYGKDSGRLEREAGTTVTRYEREHMCDYPANASVGWRDPGWVHDGVMKGLEKGKRYYYQVC